MKPRTIGQAIRYWWDANGLKVVVRQAYPRWKESALAAWWVALTFCFGFFIVQFFTVGAGQERLGLFIFLSFLAYYDFRIGKALLWRKYGKELIWTEGDRLYIKRDIRGYGKARRYFVDNIKHLNPIAYGETSFRKHMESSFWVVGGETVRFWYHGKAVEVGRQLTEEEARELAELLNKELRERQKKGTE